MTKRTYSWKPDVADHRDQIFKNSVRSVNALPPFVNRIGMDVRIENQGSLGSCTGNASTSMLEIKLKTNTQLSRLMAYYNGRVIDGTVKSDDGAQIRSVIKGLVKNGVSAEKTWPYIISKFDEKPSLKSIEEGAELVAKKTHKYCRVSNLTGVLENLSKGNTVTFGFSVPSSIDELPESAILALPTTKDKIVGGHAVLAVGYDRPNKFVWVRNSWGKEWGIDGYFKMPFGWFTDSRRLVDDMWTFY